MNLIVPEKRANSRNSCILPNRDLHGRAGLRNSHGSELVNIKGLSVLANALLSKEHGSRRVAFDQQGNNQQNRA